MTTRHTQIAQSQVKAALLLMTTKKKGEIEKKNARLSRFSFLQQQHQHQQIALASRKRSDLARKEEK